MIKQFLKEVKKKGDYIKNTIIGWKNDKILGVRGLGLMLGIIVPDGEQKAIVSELSKAGVLALTAGVNAVRLLPPLTITYGEIDCGLKIMEENIRGRRCVMAKHLLKMLDLSKTEILGYLDLADQLKYEKKHGIAPSCIKWKIPRHDFSEIVHPHKSLF